MTKILSYLMVIAFTAVAVSCGGPSRIDRGNYMFCEVIDQDKGGNDPSRYYSLVFRGDPVEWKSYAHDFETFIAYNYGGELEGRNCSAFSSANEARADLEESRRIDATGRLRPILTNWSPW